MIGEFCPRLERKREQTLWEKIRARQKELQLFIVSPPAHYSARGRTFIIIYHFYYYLLRRDVIYDIYDHFRTRKSDLRGKT